MTDEEIKQTVLYKDCYERVKQFPELAGDLVSLLREAYEETKGNYFNWEFDLILAFTWADSKLGFHFWDCVIEGRLPKEYE